MLATKGHNCWISLFPLQDHGGNFSVLNHEPESLLVCFCRGCLPASRQYFFKMEWHQFCYQIEKTLNAMPEGLKHILEAIEELAISDMGQAW